MIEKVITWVYIFFLCASLIVFIVGFYLASKMPMIPPPGVVNMIIA